MKRRDAPGQRAFEQGGILLQKKGSTHGATPDPAHVAPRSGPTSWL